MLLLLDEVGEGREVACDHCEYNFVLSPEERQPPRATCMRCHRQHPSAISPERHQMAYELALLYPSEAVRRHFGRVRMWWQTEQGPYVQYVHPSGRTMEVSRLAVAYHIPDHTVLYTPRMWTDGVLRPEEHRWLSDHPEWGKVDTVMRQWDATASVWRRTHMPLEQN